MLLAIDHGNYNIKTPHHCFMAGLAEHSVRPPMERQIENLPPLVGKVITWLLVTLMVCNAALTSAAMLRYTDRQSEPFPPGAVESFLDERYPDSYMERRWPNMTVRN